MRIYLAMTFDGIDAKILALLQTNNRLTSEEIGRRIHLSSTAVAKRVKKLRESGLISGKSVFFTFALAQAEKFGCQLVLFDKDRGAEIFVRAVGGAYLSLKSGVSTACAPLKALELTPANLAFLGQLVRKLVSVDDRPLSVADESRIDAGLVAMRDLPREERSLSALRVFLGQRDPEGIGARLERWCKSGPLGWVLDADEDVINLEAFA